MDEGRAALLHVGHCGSHRVLEPLSLEDQLGSVGAAGLDLRHRRVLWDEDPRLDAGLTRRPRDRLAVVAGARCDHAGLAFASERNASRFTAPRTLNAPVRWRFSALSQTSRPTMREKVSEL